MNINGEAVFFFSVQDGPRGSPYEGRWAVTSQRTYDNITAVFDSAILARHLICATRHVFFLYFIFIFVCMARVVECTLPNDILLFCCERTT